MPIVPARGLALVGLIVAMGAPGPLLGAQSPATWTLRPPRAEIGHGEIELHRVRGAAMLPDGRFAIADGSDRRVHVVSARGTVERTLGRAGGGPAEFQSIQRLDAVGDTLIVMDGLSQRMTLWHADGTLLRTVPLSAPAARIVEGHGVLAGAHEYVITMPGGAVPPRNGLFHDTLQLQVHDARTGSRRDLGAREWAMSYAVNESDGATRYGTPFLGRTLVAASRGRLVLLPLGAVVAEILGSDGKPTARVALPIAQRPFDRTRVRAYRDSLLAMPGADGRRVRARIEYVFGDAFPMPRHVAAAQRAVTVGGSVWLQAYPTGDEPTVPWFVVDVERARLVARVPLPRGWIVLGGDDRWALVLRRDDLGVESVGAYEIDRGRAP